MEILTQFIQVPFALILFLISASTFMFCLFYITYKQVKGLRNKYEAVEKENDQNWDKYQYWRKEDYKKEVEIKDLKRSIKSYKGWITKYKKNIGRLELWHLVQQKRHKKTIDNLENIISMDHECYKKDIEELKSKLNHEKQSVRMACADGKKLSKDNEEKTVVINKILNIAENTTKKRI